MTSVCRFFVAIGLGLCLVSPGSAQDKSDPGPKPASDEVITRGELVTDLEKILNRWEAQSTQYATKSEMRGLTRLLMQLRDEMDDTGTRIGEMENETLRTQERLDGADRPSF